MSQGEFRMLSDDQINYSSLPDDVLKELVLGPDLFVANSALATLATRHSELATTLSQHILDTKHGDHYLQAAALNTIFEADRQKALELIKRELTGCDPYVFNAILEIMIQHTELFRSLTFQPVVHAACQRINELGDGVKWPASEVKGSFLRLYCS